MDLGNSPGRPRGTENGEVRAMEAHRIGILSDTHGLLRPEAAEILKTCEVMFHAGDIDNPRVLEELEKICPVYAVRGNADKDWAEHLPADLERELWGFRFYAVHNKKHRREDLAGVDFMIYGHSHKYEVKQEGNCTLLNPGSCGPRRFRQPVTLAVLTLYPEEHRFEIQRQDLTAPAPEGEAKDLGTDALTEKNMDRLVRRIVREMESGRSVEQIAARNRTDKGLVEQICRIYATHPGVDVDGILNRMEIRGR